MVAKVNNITRGEFLIKVRATLLVLRTNTYILYTTVNNYVKDWITKNIICVIKMNSLLSYLRDHSNVT